MARSVATPGRGPLANSARLRLGLHTPNLLTTMHTTDAGDFDEWLCQVTETLRAGSPVAVPCGDCRGCCSAGQFIRIEDTDVAAKNSIPKQYVVKGVGSSEGAALMGFTDVGLCPMLQSNDCSIYVDRPATCRQFDCRVLAVAGLSLTGRWADRVNDRVRTWRFTFADETGMARALAVREAAEFISSNADLFPGGRVPTHPIELAVLALKVHGAFLGEDVYADRSSTVRAVVALSHTFEAERLQCQRAARSSVQPGQSAPAA